MAQMVYTLVIAYILAICLVPVRTLFHEVGHVIALLVSRSVLHRHEKLNIKIYVRGLQGKTFSDFYVNFNCLSKNDKKNLAVLRFNAISGYVSELLFYVILGNILYETYFLHHAPVIVISVSIQLIFLFLYSTAKLIPSAKKERYDLYIALHPDSFRYDDTVPEYKTADTMVVIVLTAIYVIFALVL